MSISSSPNEVGSLLGFFQSFELISIMNILFIPLMGDVMNWDGCFTRTSAREWLWLHVRER